MPSANDLEPNGIARQPPVIHQASNDISLRATSQNIGQEMDAAHLNTKDPDSANNGPVSQSAWDGDPSWNNRSARMEEEDVARAIQLSLLEQKAAKAKTDEVAPATAPTPESPVKKKPHRTLQDMVDNLAHKLPLRLSNEFLPIMDDQGDTLVYIGPPAKTKDQSASNHAHVRKHFDRFYHIASRKLKALNSDKFDKLLQPNACIRAEKRLSKLDAYKSVGQDTRDATKYHVDLRPPNEDEEAVILLTDLSCSSGILHWHLALGKYDLSPTAVLGTDELDTESNPYSVDHHAMSRGPAVGEEGDTDAKRVDLALGNTSEYSRLRHHSAVERLLHAICGEDPKLDSAPKLWTFFALAAYYDCAQHHSINKWVSKWLSKPGNCKFVQTNPEVAYRIGLGTQDPVLVRDAFSILVGEKALIDICSEMNGIIFPSRVSVHGRQQENLDDDEQNRVSHAASSLVRRMTRVFRSVAVDLDWITGSGEYQKLCNLKGKDSEENDSIKSAKKLIQAFVKGRFLVILRENLLRPFSDLDTNAGQTTSFRHGTVLSFETTYNSLRQEARPFTRTLWMALQRARFQEGYNNVSTTHIIELVHRDHTGNEAYEGIKIISREVLFQKLEEVNSIISQHQLATGTISGNHEYENVVVESLKHASHDHSATPKKRRKTMERETQPFSLPFRPFLSKLIPGLAPGDSQAEELKGTDVLPLPNDVTNQSAQTGEGPSMLPALYPALPSLSQQSLHSRPEENVMGSTTDTREQQQQQQQQQFSGYIREFDPEAGHDSSNAHTRNDSWGTLTDWSKYVNMDRMLIELSASLSKKCEDIIYPQHLFHGTEGISIDLIDHLVCLDDDEWKFLPLFCGGLDDGTGGVFDDMEVPNLEAGGFKGGKRGLGNVTGTNGEGSVSGSESSFDDIAGEAVSTVGKASKAATDGTRTVRSLSEDGESENSFMDQEDVYKAIQEMRMEQIGNGRMKGVNEELDFGMEEDGDVSTIMGGGSDVQGDMFADIDDDDNDDDDKVAAKQDDDQDGGARIDIKGKGKAVDSDDDMDLQVIDKNNL